MLAGLLFRDGGGSITTVELGQVSTDKLEAITNKKGTMSRDFLDSGLYSYILLVLADMPRKDF
jgi:hypothetical protein